MNDDFPALPPTRELVLDEPLWTYKSGGFVDGGVAHVRVWATDPVGHLVIVSQSGVGVSVTNAAEYIWRDLVDQFGLPLVMLEHYPPAESMPDDGDTLDQVVVVDGSPRWRAVWPVAPDSPAFTEHDTWMRAYGFELLTQ